MVRGGGAQGGRSRGGCQAMRPSLRKKSNRSPTACATFVGMLRPLLLRVVGLRPTALAEPLRRGPERQGQIARPQDGQGCTDGGRGGPPQGGRLPIARQTVVDQAAEYDPSHHTGQQIGGPVEGGAMHGKVGKPAKHTADAEHRQRRNESAIQSRHSPPHSQMRGICKEYTALAATATSAVWVELPLASALGQWHAGQNRRTRLAADRQRARAAAGARLLRAGAAQVLWLKRPRGVPRPP